MKKAILDSGLSVPELVRTAWASAASFRASDMRGGANGARIALSPQKDWAINNPAELARVLDTLDGIRKDFNGNKTRVSLADVIVLAGCVGVETAANNAGHNVAVPFTPGRTDATQEMTDVDSFAVLEPKSDGFRNFHAREIDRPAEELLVDRAHKLTLTAPSSNSARDQHQC